MRGIMKRSVKFLGLERNFSISHDHICTSKFRYQRQMVLILDGASKIGFANYPIASLFNQVDVILGGKLISSATNTYAHCSILEVLLNYDKEALESQLGCGLSCKDTIGQMEEIDINADSLLTTRLGTRSEWTK